MSEEKETVEGAEAVEQAHEGPNVKHVHMPSGLLAALLGSGAKGIHEIGVQGSVIEQTKNFLEENMKVEFCAIEGPDGKQVPAVVGREGIEVIDPSQFDKWATQPRFRKGTAKLTDLSSFIAHSNRYKDSHTLVFANDDRTAPSMTAVLNYHEAGAEGEPRFGDHRSHFAFPLSDEWKAWKEMNAVPMQMAGFARFLEDHIVDVMPTHLVEIASDDEGTKRFVDTLGGLGRIADPAQLMSLASNLHINEHSTISQAQVLSSGEVKLDFQSSHDATQNGQSITMPTMFIVGIPVFKNGPAYQIFARLRYRKQGSALSFWYELWRDDRVFDRAFDESVTRVQDETGLTVLMGTDEGR